MQTPGDTLGMRRVVRDSYNRLGERYAAWASALDDHARERYARQLLDTLPPGARVLDLGCGNCSPHTARLARCFAVTGVDFSIVQLKLASAVRAPVDLICADFCDLQFPGETFEAVTAFYSLTHVPPADSQELFLRVAFWLKPGGQFVGSLGVTADPGTIQHDWLGVDMYFSGLGLQRNRTLFKRAGLSIELDKVETIIEFGQPVSFHWIAARKPDRL